MKEKKLYEFEIKLKPSKDAPTFQALKPINADAPYKVADICRKCFDDARIEWIEEVVVIALNRSLNVLGYYIVSSGGVSSCIVDPRVVFQFALLANASSIILAHNHPSGNLRPSQADELMTAKIKQAARFLDIELMDHVIVTAEGFYSFAQEGKL